MAKLSRRHRPGVELVYPIAQRFVDECLASDGSLFLPGTPIWTAGNLEEFKQRFVDAPDGTAPFLEQFEDQLRGAPAACVQLAAEILYIYLLPVTPAVIGAAKKRDMLKKVLSWSDEPVSLPADVDAALDGGLLKPGQYYSTKRPRQMSWLTRFMVAWKALDPAVRSRALADPWYFLDLVRARAEIGDGAEPQRRSLLHLAHPETFEAIFSLTHIDTLLTVFGDDISPTGDRDRDLAAVREHLAAKHGDDFDFYRSPVHELWRDVASPPAAPAKASAASDAEDLVAAEPDSVGSLAALADNLLLPVEFVTEVVDLLEDKRQLVFHGPPGTGKTFIARALARHLGADDDSIDMVQLHASYSYEDFVEGYRPVKGGGFDIVAGPLRRIAARAEENPGVAHVLVIDEMNRGNLAKVFGELYFLLEYRGDSITLQYSAEPFGLPENLWIIGTMNTADRSIALLDSALRRRFYFVELSPSAPPVSNLLRRWLVEQDKKDLLWVADVVERANDLIGDRHAAIGPSYFMRDELDAAWVERIWQHAVEPLLAEHFFGEEQRLTEFPLDRLRAEVGQQPPQPPTAAEPSPLRAAPPTSQSAPRMARTQFDREVASLPDGTTLTYRNERAVIKSGALELSDGTLFPAPTTAARHINGGVSVNGWRAWLVEGAMLVEGDHRRKATLADLHDSPDEIEWTT